MYYLFGTLKFSVFLQDILIYEMGTLFFYLFLALGISFFCSLMESVLLSTPLSYINMMEAEGRKNADLLRKYKDDIDKPLAAILSLNTIANTIGAAGVGAQVVRVFGNEWLGLGSAILTFLILVLSEIIPKTIGSNYWRKLSIPVAKLLRVLIVIMYPFVLLSKLLMRVIGKKNHEAAVSREEVSAMVEMAAEEGEIEVSENKIIQNIVKLESVKVEDVMTPQTVVSIAPEEMTVQEFYKNKEYLHFARIPVYADDDEDHITGYVLRQKVLESVANDKFNTRLSDIKRLIVVAEEGQTLTKLWETLLKEKEHIALIVDEYGSFTGIVTLEDIIESIFGLEIVDETDSVEDMQQYARNKWKERKEEYKHIIEAPDEEEDTEEDGK